MDAGTAAATSNGRLRQQLLSSDVYGEQGQQFDPYGNEYRKGNSLRKASLTSQSAMSMNRLFRRKAPQGAAFNDEAGADVMDLTSGANVSFDDIAHLRDTGPYVSGAVRLDTAPIIPTLGAGIQPGKAINNVQYRKQMNQQKKMAMASSARAMSMGGQNPMNPQGDPRAMSMGGFNPMNDPRAMSMGGINPMNDPRAMSMGGVNPMNDPRSMSLMNGNPMDPRTMSMGGPNGPNAYNPQMAANGRAMSMGGPRTMSMGQRPPMNQYGGPQMQPAHNPQAAYGPYGYGQQPGNGQYMPNQQYGPRAMSLRPGPNGPAPRTMSLNSNGHVSPNQMPPPGHNQYRGQGPPPTLAPAKAPMQNLYSRNLVSSNGETYQRVTPSASQADITQSSDSLMKVEEEEVEPVPNEQDEDDDVVYKFDDNDESVSRKSTIQKSNSMRLRKLDLFNQERKPSNLGEDEVQADNSSFDTRSFESTEEDINVGNAPSRDLNVGSTQGYLNDENLPSPTVGRTPKRRGADNGDENDSMHSPTRSKDLPGLPDEYKNLDEYKTLDDYKNLDDHKTLPSKPSIRLLVTNTAYHNFRPPANDSTATLGSSNYSDINTPTGDLAGGSFGEAGTNIENHDDQKVHRWSQHETAPTTASTSHGSHRSEDHKHVEDSNSNYDINEPAVSHDSVPTDKSSIKTRGTKKETIPESPRENASESRRSSRSFSLSSNIFKRFSKSGKRSNSTSEDVAPRRASATLPPSTTTTATTTTTEPVGVKFTKEELGIMQENGALLNELELVSTELASSIRRELALESRLQDRDGAQPEGDLARELVQKLKEISDLQEKLNKERRLRFISEEHALFLENGVSPSPLKLNYEKTELYKQLLIKNDMVNQLQDKLAEYQDKDDYLLLYEKYQHLVKEHTDLKYNVVPELERRSKGVRKSADRSLVLAPEDDVEYSQALEIARLQSQREDLREVVNNMQQQHKHELGHAQDKIRKLQAKLRDIAAINDKLTSRMELGSLAGSNNSSQQNLLLAGGKLQGLSIVSPTKSIFD